MSGCQLYYTLNANLPKKDLTVKNKNILLNSIPKLTKDQLEQVFLLICEHQKVKRGTDYNSENIVIPYGGTSENLGIQFDLTKFPIELRWVLFKFIDIVVKIDI